MMYNKFNIIIQSLIDGFWLSAFFIVIVVDYFAIKDNAVTQFGEYTFLNCNNHFCRKDS